MKLIAMIMTASLALSAQAPRDAPARPAVGAAAIAGVVLSDSNPPQPIRRAIVTISGAALRGDRQFVTDDNGRFAFEAIPSGRYTLTAEKPAYVKTYYGSRRPGRAPGTPIVIADGQRADIRLQLLRGAVIAGVVRDENGQPLAGSQVHVTQPVIIDGQRKLVSAPAPRPTTDDLGRYRVYGLPAGDYAVSTSGSGGAGLETTEAQIQAALRGIAAPGTRVPPPPDSGQLTRSNRYFPSAANPADAELVSLATGEERLDVNITVPFVRAARMEGLSIGPGGQPMPNVWVVMSAGAERNCWASPGLIRPNAEGRFSLPNLASGQYGLVARGAEGTSTPQGAAVPMPLWAEADFVMEGENISNVLLQFAPGVDVTGRVAFRGTQPPPDLARLRISLARTNAAGCGEPAPLPTVSPRADGTFTLTGLPPGKYRVTVNGAASPWTLRSAALNGQDALDVPFEIGRGALAGLEVVFTDAPTEVSGLVTDNLGRPAPEYSVVAFSADRTLWSTAPRRLSGAIKLDSNGRYRIAGLPPGEYYIALLTDIDSRQASDPAVLESLIPASLRITVSEGEKKTQDIKLGS